MELYEQVVKACQSLQDKKALDIVVLDVSKTSSITSYLIIATATSNTHARALLDATSESMANLGIVPFHKEGYGQSDWVVVDFGDFIVHIFTESLREYYNLEKLYQDGKNLRKFDSILKDLMSKQKKLEKKNQQQQKQQEKKLAEKQKEEQKKIKKQSKAKQEKSSNQEKIEAKEKPEKKQKTKSNLEDSSSKKTKKSSSKKQTKNISK